jgi:hypothetical protein
MRWLPLAIIPVLLSCSDPRDTVLPKDLSKPDTLKPVLEKLSQEERDLLAGYMVRHTMGTALGSAFGVKPEPVPEGITVRKAIDEQRTVVEKNRAEEAARKAAKEKAEAERQALAAEMAQVLAVRLIDVRLHKATFRDFDVENYINFAFEFQNKGTKGITGVKGSAIFKDRFGDKIAELPLKVEENMPAGKNVTVKLQKRYNQFRAEDQQLAAVDPSSTSFVLAPEVVLFADGTKFEAPAAPK